MKASMGSIPISWMTTSNKEIQPWIRRFANSASRILGLGHISVPSSIPYLSFLFGLIQRTAEEEKCKVLLAQPKIWLCSYKRISTGWRHLFQPFPSWPILHFGWKGTTEDLLLSRHQRWFLLSHSGHVIQVTVQNSIQMLSLLDTVMLKI